MSIMQEEITPEKLNEFLKNSEYGKKITVNDLSKDVQFIILDYIKEHS